MKICQNCGMQMPDSAKFCRMCGTILGDPEPVPEQEDSLMAEPAAEAEPAEEWKPAAEAESAEEWKTAAEAEFPEEPAPAIAPAPAPVSKSVPEPASVRQPGPLDHTEEFAAEDISGNKLFAMAAYLLGPLGIIIAILAGKDSAFTRFHVKQALKLTVIEALFAIAAMILWCLLLLPMIVTSTFNLIVILLIALIALLFVILHIVCFVMVCRNKAVEVPVIRGFRFLK